MGRHGQRQRIAPDGADIDAFRGCGRLAEARLESPREQSSMLILQALSVKTNRVVRIAPTVYRHRYRQPGIGQAVRQGNVQRIGSDQRVSRTTQTLEKTACHRSMR